MKNFWGIVQNGRATTTIQLASMQRHSKLQKLAHMDDGL
jgi:hypothetical protein